MSASKDKGTRAETAVVRYLQACGHELTERRALRGAADAGDIAGLGGLVVEVKNVHKMDLAGWIDEMRLAKATAGVALGVVWHKRWGKTNPGDWYVTMTGADFVKLVEGRK